MWKGQSMLLGDVTEYLLSEPAGLFGWQSAGTRQRTERRGTQRNSHSFTKRPGCHYVARDSPIENQFAVSFFADTFRHREFERYGHAGQSKLETLQELRARSPRDL